jgi:hypothetical protein
MPHLKLSKTYDFGTKVEKQTKIATHMDLMKIWSNFDHSKVPNS